jgi:membrane protein DedA with SNARE-associated domain
MRLFSFLLSIVVFIVSAYFFAIKVNDIYSFDDMIYVALLVILMAICITGILINWGDLRQTK